MNSPVFQLLYMSSANKELTEEVLLEILAVSRERNAAEGITGLLLYSEGNIIQILEGSKSKVEALFAKIKCDLRHHQIVVLSQGWVKKRDFSEFRMGFQRVSKQQLSTQMPGFSDIVENRQLPEATLSTLSKNVAIFLKTFAHSTRIER